MKSGMKPFRFSNMWTEHPNPRFLEVVKEAWTAEVRVFNKNVFFTKNAIKDWTQFWRIGVSLK